MTPAHLLPGPLADSLQRNRAAFNTSFTQAQHAGARIDPVAFSQHLTALDPALRAIHNHFPEKTDAAAVALYDLALELFTAGLLGPTARNPAVAQLWQNLFPAIPRLLAREPRRIAASLSNAVHNLAQIPCGRPTQWINSMSTFAPQCDDAATLFDAGTIAAWQSGAPQYRAAALQLARKFPANLLVPLLFPADSPLEKIPQALQTLASHRWLTPAEALDGPIPSRIRIVQTAGDFRGFGGHFLRPPIVATQGPNLVISDGHFLFSILADASGCLIQRIAPGRLKPDARTGIIQLFNTGNIVWDSTAAAHFPELANFTSAAFDGQTLAITLPDSHHVYLLARG